MKIEIIASGRNNLVSKVLYKKKKYIYKKYLKNKGNGIRYSRYNSETSFISLLRKKKIKNLPSIIATDSKKQENIFNYISGNKIKKITKGDILQCVNFIKTINKDILKKEYINFKNATEACFSIDHHIQTANNRILLLQKFSKNTGVYKEAKFFINTELKKKLKKIKKNIYKSFSKKEIAKRLSKKDLILSPSDFGFHNAIKRNNKIFFFDFEYAGMDDPVKLMSDFICQPDYQLTKKQSYFFINNILKIFPQNEKIKRRFKAVINVHRIKWCCIILSEILNKSYFKRRFFSGSQIDPNKCLKKAKKYYKLHLKKIN